jgi:predicted HicB family RNase H-like nuclease
MNIIKYKGYIGTVEYSPDDKVLYGKIEHINDLVTFEAKTANDLEKNFRATVDDYIETCRQLGKEPQKTFKGTFNVRIKPKLHRKASMVSLQRNISLNKLVEQALEHELKS